MEEVGLFSAIIFKYSSDLDEVGALVFDLGSHSFRAGFGGEETPKVIFSVIFPLFIQQPTLSVRNSKEPDLEFTIENCFLKRTFVH